MAREALVTECRHPRTVGLAQLAETDLLKAYRLLADLDLAALEKVALQHEKISSLQEICSRVIAQGGRIILVGCGASGRIAAQLEHDWRQHYQGQKRAKALLSVLSGGDVTLIEAAEAGEDQPEQAILQLAEVGLQAKDLIIALSAGGESPFILGALEHAQGKTQEQPWLLCCNPVTILLQRNPLHPIGHPGIAVLALDVGPMALTGSTRMQATSSMTFALLQILFPEEWDGKHFLDLYQCFDWSKMIPLTFWEASCYQRKEAVVYEVSAVLAMPVLADMTERAPTFNVPAFPNRQDAEPILLNHLILAGAQSGEAAWEALLLRKPRGNSARLYGFDLSSQYLDVLKKIQPNLQILTILQSSADIKICFSDQEILLPVQDWNILEQQFFLRLLLVNHSTLLMGRLGYYKSNFMTNLKPSNVKLVDRAIRYVLTLHAEEGLGTLDYQTVEKALHRMLPDLKSHESIVFKLLTTFNSR